MRDINEVKEFLIDCIERHGYYQDLYKDVNINEIQDFDDFREDTPAISKDKMIEFFEDGNFQFNTQEIEDPVLGRPTSGTTSDMACYYRTKGEIESHCERFVEAADHFFEGGKNKDRVLVATTFSLLPILSNQFLEKGCMVTSGSPFDIERSAETIRRMNVNSIVASPSIALKLTERLDDAGYEGLEKYYLISSGLSSPTEDKIRERYPEAEIMMQYGLAETGILMKQCKHLKGTNQYHTFDDQSPFYYEFITDEGNEAQPGEIGEITVTKMNRKTPLIRYQVGDLFEMRDECECGERVYKFIGRKEDKFKIQGVTVFRERIEDALESVEKHIKQYQVIIDERDYEDMPKPVIRLRVELDEDTESNKEKIKETFASNFQVAEDYNWQKGVEMGIFAPVEIESNKFEERKFRAVKDIRYED